MPIPVLYLDAQKKTALDNGFAAAFGTAPERYFSAPGRTEIGGNHTDHQHGCVLAAAVNLETVAETEAMQRAGIASRSTFYRRLKELKVN
mgnify:CR=1 FL=1